MVRLNVRPFLVGEDERDGGCRRERRVAFDGPERVRSGNRTGIGVADEADLGKIAGRQVRRVEELDRGRVVVDRLMVAFQPDVVDASADQVDRARKARRVDLDALAGGDRCLAALGGRCAARRAGNRTGRRRRRVAGSVGILRRGRLLLGGYPLLLDARRLAFGLDLRIHVEDLPERQDQHRKRNGDKEIAVVFHRRPLGS